MAIQACAIAQLEGQGFVDLSKNFETGQNKDGGTA